jgi:hypothetical protein
MTVHVDGLLIDLRDDDLFPDGAGTAFFCQSTGQPTSDDDSAGRNGSL